MLAEIGYRLHSKDWGQGLASEGASALLNWAFGNVGYDKVVGCTIAVNLGSRRVMEKIGMKHVSTDYPDYTDAIPGTEEGEVRYELLRSEWKCR